MADSNLPSSECNSDAPSMASGTTAGIVRAQGGTPATVALGRWSIDFYNGQAAAYGTDSGFRELGYLILAVTDQDERDQAEEHRKGQLRDGEPHDR